MEQKHYESPDIGNQITTVLKKIPKEIINNPTLLEQIMLEGLRKDNFTVLGILPYKFNPHGYTMLVLLAESHLAIHTYPEKGTMYFNLYSCRGEEDGNGAFNHVRKSIPHRKQPKIDILKVDVGADTP